MVLISCVAVELLSFVWGALGGEGEYYSPSDLANGSCYSVEMVTRTLEFLRRYGFVEQLANRELIFKKVEGAPSPDLVARILEAFR
jgi:hypothetical protein